MSPEQHARAELDARSDQFSFGVTAWEVLHGVPPFRGTTPIALAEAIRAGPETPPADSDVPAWISRALRKALAPRASRRFADMQDLLGALEPGARRRRVLRSGLVVAVGAAGVVATASAFAPRVDATTHPCEIARLQAEIDEVWSPDRRSRVRAQILETKAAYAADVAADVESTVDAFTLSWLAARDQTCDVVGSSDAHDNATIDGRTACLRNNLAHVDRWLAALEAGTYPVDRTSAVAEDLTWPDVCRGGSPPLEPDDELAASLRRELANANSTLDRGEHALAIEQGRRIADAASVVGHEVARIDALHIVRVAEYGLGEAGAASRTATLAYDLAVGVEDWHRAFREARGVAYYAASLGDFGPAQGWLRTAASISERTPIGPVELARFDTDRCFVARASGRTEEARSACQAAIDRLERFVHPPAILARRYAETELATLLYDEGQYDEALDLRRRTYHDIRRQLGNWHPSVGGHAFNLALSLHAQGESAEAVELGREALAIFRRDVGNTRWVASSLMNLGIYLTAAGDLDEADRVLTEALTLADGLPAARRSRILANVSMLRRRQRRFGDALAMLRESRDIDSATLPDGHADKAFRHYAFGELLYLVGDFAEAESELRAAVIILTANGMHGLARTAGLSLALTQLRRGRAAEALVEIERQARSCETTPHDAWCPIPRALRALPLVALGRTDDAQTGIPAAPMRGNSEGTLVRLAIDHARAEIAAAAGDLDQATAWASMGLVELALKRQIPNLPDDEFMRLVDWLRARRSSSGMAAKFR